MAWNIRIDPFTRKPSQHDGIDLPFGMNTPMGAFQDGTVTRIENDPTGYGWYVDVKHDDGTTGRYAHAGIINKGVGHRVKRGEELGLVGSTGRSTGPHVHFEHHDQSGKPVDPRPFLAASGGRPETQFASATQAAPTSNLGGPSMAIPQQFGGPPLGLQDYVQQAQSLISQPNVSPELIAALSRNNSQRSANLPLALGAMLSRDQNIQQFGNVMYKDANDARNLIPLGEEGFVDPVTGTFMQSPVGEGKRKERVLEKAMQLSQAAQNSFIQMQMAAAQRAFTNAIALKTLDNGTVLANNTLDNTRNRYNNEGPNPSQGANGMPGDVPMLNTLPRPILPQASAAVNMPPPPAANSVLPLAMGAIQPPAAPPMPTQPATPGQTTAPVAPQVSQAEPSVVQATPASPAAAPSQADVQVSNEPVVAPTQAPQVSAPPTDRKYVTSIGMNPVRVGRASDGSGDVYAAPQGGEYVLDMSEGENKGKYFIRPEGVGVIKDRQVMPADKVLEVSNGYKDLNKLSEVANSFKPQYGGSKLDVIGQMQNWLGSRDSKSSLADQAAWWQNWQTYFNGVIKTLSGSAVTESEARRLAATAITPGMDPTYIQMRVQEIYRDAARAMNMLRNSFDKQGFGVDGFQVAPENLPNKGRSGGITITRE